MKHLVLCSAAATIPLSLAGTGVTGEQEKAEKLIKSATYGTKPLMK